MKSNTKWGIFYITFSICFLIGLHWGNRAVTAISQSISAPQRHTIILDAGHGGEDGGAISCTGKPESGYNLEITLCLNDLLRLLGYDTSLIRETDISVYTKGETIAQKKVSDLKHRVELVNNTENAILVSIHQNHFSDSRYNGAQVFFSKTPGSEELARNLQASFVSILNPGSRRAIKHSQGIYLMEHVSCPAILVECGFLSNVEEEHKLSDKTYQQQICCVIAGELARFLSNT